jgi:hypothetical protein
MRNILRVDAGRTGRRVQKSRAAWAIEYHVLATNARCPEARADCGGGASPVCTQARRQLHMLLIMDEVCSSTLDWARNACGAAGDTRRDNN